MTDETDSRQRILDAAEAEFADSGLAGARVAAIAEGAGLNKAMLYYYFGSKEDLYVAVLERMFGQVATLVQSTWTDVAVPEAADLERFFAGYRDILRAHPKFVYLMLRELLDGGERAVPILGPRAFSLLPVFAGALFRGQQGGTVNATLDPVVSLPAMMAPFVFFAFAHPMVSAVTGIDRDTLDAAWHDNAVRLVLHGLLARPEEP